MEKRTCHLAGKTDTTLSCRHRTRGVGILRTRPTVSRRKWCSRPSRSRAIALRRWVIAPLGRRPFACPVGLAEIEVDSQGCVAERFGPATTRLTRSSCPSEPLRRNEPGSREHPRRPTGSHGRDSQPARRRTSVINLSPKRRHRLYQEVQGQGRLPDARRPRRRPRPSLPWASCPKLNGCVERAQRT